MADEKEERERARALAHSVHERVDEANTHSTKILNIHDTRSEKKVDLLCLFTNQHGVGRAGQTGSNERDTLVCEVQRERLRRLQCAR